MNRRDIEQQLWNYIDGRCDEAAATHIVHMIATDSQWTTLYEELTALHSSLTADTELEIPSMRFTKNVLDSIENTKMATATRQYVNPLLMRLISGFFVCALFALLSYAIAYAVLQPANSTTGNNQFPFPTFDIAKITNRNAYIALTWSNIIIGLLLADSLLRRKKKKQSS